MQKSRRAPKENFFQVRDFCLQKNIQLIISILTGKKKSNKSMVRILTLINQNKKSQESNFILRSNPEKIKWNLKRKKTYRVSRDPPLETISLEQCQSQGFYERFMCVWERGKKIKKKKRKGEEENEAGVVRVSKSDDYSGMNEWMNEWTIEGRKEGRKRKAIWLRKRVNKIN